MALQLLVSIALSAWLALAGDVSSKRLINAESEPENWLSYYGTYKSWRYSPLDEVHKGNIDKLAPVWAFETGITDGGMQCAPIVVDGVMYVTSAWNNA